MAIKAFSPVGRQWVEQFTTLFRSLYLKQVKGESTFEKINFHYFTGNVFQSN
jgi:hypothetical protein